VKPASRLKTQPVPNKTRLVTGPAKQFFLTLTYQILETNLDGDYCHAMEDGTTVSLLRAAYLTKVEERTRRKRTLMLPPWLKRNQIKNSIYGADNTFETQKKIKEDSNMVA
jgi:hypothetical protein